jgi:hypothetical protein
MPVESQEASSQLLKNKYNLHKSREVETAAERTQARTGERVPQDPLARIQNYLNRFHEIIERGGPARREHNLDLIKARFHAKYVIKPNEIPESFWDNQRRIIRERGQGADLNRIDFEELKRQNTEAIIADQTSSLDRWIDYLSSPDAPYPDALKYFTLRNVLNMAEYDKEKKAYPQRSKGTTKPFPDLNREALAYVLDAVDKKYKKKNIDVSTFGENEAKEFDNLLKTENFPKLYAWAIEKVTPASEEELAGTRGEWIKYNQGQDHMPLVRSLQGHGTGWCTAGESTAEIHLKGGDFYVYYSLDREGKPTIPRAAIRIGKGRRIVEVRGIAKDQNLDPQIIPVVDEKLKEFPDGASYKKKVSDMRYLTEIENRLADEQNLTREDLIFLYEIDSQIEGFGYERDSRIEEIRSQRSPEVDMLIVFNCEPEQIAHKANDINENTRAFVGPLTQGIFDAIERHKIEYVYTSFPERRIKIDRNYEIDPITFEEFEEKRKEYNKSTEDPLRQVQATECALNIMQSEKFNTLKNKETMTLVHLKARDLFQDQGFHTTEEIHSKIQELGLNLCSPELAPQYRLRYINQPIENWVFIGMQPIADSRGFPQVFRLGLRDGGLWLSTEWIFPDSQWNPESKIIFSLYPNT